MFLAYLPNVVDYITYKHEQLALSFIHLYLYGYDVNDNMFVIRLLFMKLQYSLLKVFKRSQITVIAVIIRFIYKTTFY